MSYALAVDVDAIKPIAGAGSCPPGTAIYDRERPIALVLVDNGQFEVRECLFIERLYQIIERLYQTGKVAHPILRCYDNENCGMCAYFPCIGPERLVEKDGSATEV